MPEDGNAGGDRPCFHLVLRSARRLVRADQQIHQTAQSQQNVQSVQPAEQKNKPGMRVSRQHHPGIENFEPGRHLANQKQHGESRAPGRQPEKPGAIVPLQMMPRDFERHAAGQQDRRRGPEDRRNLKMAPIQSFTGAQKKDRDQRAERHGDGRKRYYYRQNGRRRHLAFLRGMFCYRHFFYYERSCGFACSVWLSSSLLFRRQRTIACKARSASPPITAGSSFISKAVPPRAASSMATSSAPKFWMPSGPSSSAPRMTATITGASYAPLPKKFPGRRFPPNTAKSSKASQPVSRPKA